MSIDLKQLKYFLAVAEEKSFSRAAERLHISQPPLSQQIMKLESELGVRLFARTTRSFELTVAGKALLHAAAALLGGQGKGVWTDAADPTLPVDFKLQGEFSGDKLGAQVIAP